MREYMHVDINRTGSSSVRKALGLQNTAMHVVAEAKKRQNPVKFNRSFVFTVVRNPFDRAVSQYSHRKAVEGNPSFKQWLVKRYVENDRTCEHHDDYPYWHTLWLPQWRWLCDWDTGEVLVDYIGRFESLDRSWIRICEQIGMNIELPHVGNLTWDRPHYSTYYDDEAREIVEDVFSRDIEMFGYSYSSFSATNIKAHG